MPHLEKICEATTRLVKHSIRIVREIFKQHMVTFMQIVIQ